MSMRNQKGQAIFTQSMIAVVIAAILIGGIMSIFISGTRFYAVHNAYIQASVTAENAVTKLANVIRRAKKDTIVLNKDGNLFSCQMPLGIDSDGDIQLGVILSSGVSKDKWKIAYKNVNVSGMGESSHPDLVKEIYRYIGTNTWALAADTLSLNDSASNSLADVSVTITGYLIDQTGSISETTVKPDFVVINATAYKKAGKTAIEVNKTISVDIRN